MDRQAQIEEHVKRQKDLSLAYLRFLNSDDGRKIIADLASVCFADRSTFSEQPNRVFFNEGCRAVYLHILKRATVKQTPPQKEGEENV